ncbi:HigA family addiction module antidote protein [bacterium]|nr:HigA family addiction module antidote protein [bacterium]
MKKEIATHFNRLGFYGLDKIVLGHAATGVTDVFYQRYPFDDDLKKALKLSQNKIANELGVPPRRINEIVNSKRSITADTAIRLSLYSSNTPQFWMSLQMDYDLDTTQDKLLDRLKSEVNTAHAVDIQPIEVLLPGAK